MQGNDGISIKLSALHPRYEALQRERVLAELVPRVARLCEQAARANINLTIDAEEVDRLELSLDVFEALAAHVAARHPQWQGFGLALQAYQTRALELIAEVGALARRPGHRRMCRRVKGAFWDAAIKRAQELGLPHYPVYTHKHHTDISYLACARALLEAQDVIFPQFATHNAGTIAAIVQMAQRNGAAFELQRLHGMGEGVYREVLRDGQLACRVYAPVGQHRERRWRGLGFEVELCIYRASGRVTGLGDAGERGQREVGVGGEAEVVHRLGAEADEAGVRQQPDGERSIGEAEPGEPPLQASRPALGTALERHQSRGLPVDARTTSANATANGRQAARISSDRSTISVSTASVVRPHFSTGAGSSANHEPRISTSTSGWNCTAHAASPRR